jgi:integrase/recombinase XerD
VPIEQVTNRKVLDYIDLLIDKKLKPKTVNCQLDSIRGFYEYLRDEERLKMDNPVKRGYALKLSQPLPKHLRDEEVAKLLAVITSARDRCPSQKFRPR